MLFRNIELDSVQQFLPHCLYSEPNMKCCSRESEKSCIGQTWATETLQRTAGEVRIGINHKTNRACLETLPRLTVHWVIFVTRLTNRRYSHRLQKRFLMRIERAFPISWRHFKQLMAVFNLGCFYFARGICKHIFLILLSTICIISEIHGSTHLLNLVCPWTSNKIQP